MSQTKAELIDGKGDVVFDTDTLAVDATNNRIGVGESAPGTQVEINSAEPYITIKNSSEEDTDGGRESKIIFEGEQSGGEISTLAQIEVSHDGTADDEKGKIVISTNDGDDGTTPTERMRIDSDGRLLVGTSSNYGLTTNAVFAGDSSKGIVSIINDGDTFINTNDQLGAVEFGAHESGGTAYIGASIQGTADSAWTGDSPGRLIFSTTADSASSPTERMRISSDGNVSIADGNLILANGHGIDFSATANGTGATNISELLDDYEEGTFTPEYEGGTTAGSFTYSTNLGIYTKIGRQVFVEIILTNITEVTAGTGTLFVTGLPFADTISHSCGSVRFDNFTFANGTNYVVPVRGGNTKIQFQEVKSGLVDSAMGVNDRNGNLSDIFLSYSYYVD